MVFLLTLPAAAAEPAPRATYTRNVAIVLYDGVEILDFAGPSEVFQAAGRFGRSGVTPAFRVYTVAVSREPLTSQGFVKIVPEFTFDDAPAPDLVVFPGGSSDRLTEDEKAMRWATKTMGAAEVTLTVCTGAFVPAKAGLLDGLDVTTYYGAIDGLKQEAPKARVQEGRRFIDNGKIVTTAGIDGALHVVARLLGCSVADRTARYMEYRWTPESYLAEQYSLLNPSLDAAGRAMQQAMLLEEAKDFEGAAEAWRAILAKDSGNAFAWYRLGFSLHGMGKLDEAVQAANKAAESPELRGRALFNVACARAVQGRKPEALEALRGAVDAGFKESWYLKNEPDLASIRSDPGFAAILAKL
jgi:transcriptional regulator GlxA family with amidase domain